MTGILTNSGARTALAMLGRTERHLGVTQEQVATGRSVGTARGNSSVWAISDRVLKNSAVDPVLGT